MDERIKQLSRADWPAFVSLAWALAFGVLYARTMIGAKGALVNQWIESALDSLR